MRLQNDKVSTIHRHYMAKINQGILGGFSGRIGTVVGYIRKGQPIIRSLPSKPQTPPSQGQTNARMRFAALRTVIPAFVPAMKIGFRSQLDTKMVHCVAFSDMWSAGVVGEAPKCALDFSKIAVSRGRVACLAEAVVVRAGEAAVVRWAPLGNIPPADGSDEVYLCVYSPEETKVRLSEPVRRSEGTLAMAVPDGPLHCYLFAASAESRETSTSQYFELL